MGRTKSRMLKTSILAGVLAIGAGGGIANAAGPHQGGHHRCYDGCGCPVVEYAGTLTIDGRSFLIRSDRGMLGQIATAFRRAGYRASVRNGCVHVDYGACRPSVRWRTDEYRASFTWRYGSLGVELRKPRAVPVYRPHRPAYRPAYRPGFRWGFRRGRCG